LSDPAVDAAKRAAAKWGVRMVNYDNVITSAAREALVPLRSWYERWEGANPDEFDDFYPMLDSVKALIYPSEEL